MSETTTTAMTIRQLTPAQNPFAPNEPKNWYDNEPSTTEFFHALSVLFPEGENFFVRSVMAFMRHPAVAADAKLREEVRGFVSQEVHHASTHIRYNKEIEGRFNHRMEKVGRFVKWLLSIPETYRTFSDQKTNCLAITCSLEHLTATLGELLLATDGGVLTLCRMSPSHRALWIYHAVEETEHKAVAYDVYQRACGGYVRRVWTHIVATALFLVVFIGVYLLFMWDNGHLFNVFSHAKLVNFLFISPAPLRRAFPIWCEYFSPHFHPWNKDNGFLIKKWEGLVARGTVVTVEDIKNV